MAQGCCATPVQGRWKIKVTSIFKVFRGSYIKNGSSFWDDPRILLRMRGRVQSEPAMYKNVVELALGIGGICRSMHCVCESMGAVELADSTIFCFTGVGCSIDGSDE